jgi:hypothetical protein
MKCPTCFQDYEVEYPVPDQIKIQLEVQYMVRKQLKRERRQLLLDLYAQGHWSMGKLAIAFNMPKKTVEHELNKST